MTQGQTKGEYICLLEPVEAYVHTIRPLVSRARPFFPVLVGVAGSAAGKKGLVSLSHIPWHLQECRQIQ